MYFTFFFTPRVSLADVKNDRNCLIIELIMKRNVIFFLNSNFFEKYVGAVEQ
jgi:hypothetical protein